jgi:hypothetical protein
LKKQSSETLTESSAGSDLEQQSHECIELNRVEYQAKRSTTVPMLPIPINTMLRAATLPPLSAQCQFVKYPDPHHSVEGFKNTIERQTHVQQRHPSLKISHSTLLLSFDLERMLPPKQQDRFVSSSIHASTDSAGQNSILTAGSCKYSDIDAVLYFEG